MGDWDTVQYSHLIFISVSLQTSHLLSFCCLKQAKYVIIWSVNQLPVQGDGTSLCVDVGCGSGQSTGIYADHFKQVIGLDISQEQLDAARVRNTRPNVSYRLVTRYIFQSVLYLTHKVITSLLETIVLASTVHFSMGKQMHLHTVCAYILYK